MKIAISGKGGSGKTTISATLTRILARRGLPVLAIDGDPNPNLIQALGLGPGVETAAIPRNVVERREDENGQQRHVLTTTVADIVSKYGLKAPDGVTVLALCRCAAGCTGALLPLDGDCGTNCAVSARARH
ncbi:MAG: AAA family ATPase [Acidobacteria bacterium]|nr:AAA family ATPase [Acidobacteriota bacterium]